VTALTDEEHEAADAFMWTAISLGFDSPGDVLRLLANERSAVWHGYPKVRMLAACRALGFETYGEAIAVLRRHARQALSAFVISD